MTARPINPMSEWFIKLYLPARPQTTLEDGDKVFDGFCRLWTDAFVSARSDVGVMMARSLRSNG